MQNRFEVAVERPDGSATFFTCGKVHHDLALFLAPLDSTPVTPGGLGLNHMALQVEDFNTLREFHHHLTDCGVAIDRTTDHGMSLSIYLNDPDGNGIELFCNSQDTAEGGLAAFRRPDRQNKELVIS